MVSKREQSSFGMEYIIAANCLFEANIPDHFKLFRIPHFTISNIPLTPCDCLALGKLTSLSTAIQEPRLSLCNLDNLCIKYLKSGLLEDTLSKRIISIHIADPGIDGIGVKILSELFKKGIIVQLVGCELIAAEGFLTILQTIRSIKEFILQYIVLNWCNVEINDENGPLLQQVIQQNNFWCLNLQGNAGVGDNGAWFIAQGLKSSFLFGHLNIEECNITPKGVGLISNALKMNNTLKILKLSCNFFGDEGAPYIGKALAHNSTLQELELNNCHFSSKGARMIWKGLIYNKSVRVLDFSHNNIGDEGADCIGQTLRFNITLEKINLSTCSLTSVGAQNVSIGLKDNKSVKSLDLSMNALKDEGADFIGQALEQNNTLEEIEMSLCFMTLKGMKNLTEHIVCREVRTVKKLNFFTDFERVVN